MKQTIICAMLFLVAFSSFSQPTNSQPSITQPDYLKRSKTQKTAGKILLAGGAGLMATGLIIPKGELIYEGWGLPFDYDEYENDEVKITFITAGFLTALSSIPLFIWAGTNRIKATTVSVVNEDTVQLYNQNLVHTSFPALKVKVEF